MSETYKFYVPAGYWLIESLTAFCQTNGIGNADIAGIGSITNIWVLLDPNGTPVVRSFSAGPSYEMTSLLGNITLRRGMPMFDRSGLPSGAYPQIDKTVQTYNCYVHAHVTFANPDMSISGGHLLDAQVSIGAELVLRTMAGSACVPGLSDDEIPADCVTDSMVSVPPYGAFSNWSTPFWYPPPDTSKKILEQNCTDKIRLKLGFFFASLVLVAAAIRIQNSRRVRWMSAVATPSSRNQSWVNA